MRLAPRTARGWAVQFTLISSLALMVLVGAAAGAAATDTSTLEDWAVHPGFSLEVDSAGFNIPTAIAFVPDPGKAPGDPLYFVTELRGDIKVVTNDRSVRTFATVPTVGFQKDDFRGASQSGLAGICLDPRHGYVFVTFTYPDGSGILRNNIIRFTTSPGTFGRAPEATRDFGAIFADFQSAPAHQIGGCQVRGGSLFVGVGDGGNIRAAGDLDILLGKVLCLSVDGGPCHDGPFVKTGRGPEAAGMAARYVWAYGFRNPFGMAIVGDEVFVVENGIELDRFLKVERGAHHHWDGSDQSIATGAILVFPPPVVAPVQLTFLADAPGFVPARFANHFFFAVFGGGERASGVMAFGYDVHASRVLGVPQQVLAYRGKSEQYVIGVAFGPDGLYVAPGRPDARGQSAILRMYHDAGKEHSVVIGTASDPLSDSGIHVLQKHSCNSCHGVSAEGGGIAPSLDWFGLNNRLTRRLHSKAYEASIAEVDLRNDEPFAAFRNARREVLQAEGHRRTRIWLKHFLLEPRFDNPGALMPNPRLTEAQAEAIRDALFGPLPPARSVTDRLRDFVVRNRRAVVLGFAAGVGTSASLVLAMVAGVYTRRRRRRTG